MIRAIIFDLDGVLVDTAKFHFLAWKRMADSLGIPFTERDNERLKGVSRMTSLEIILSLGERADMPQGEKESLAEKKNAWYVEYLQELTPNDLLPGIDGLLTQCAGARIKTAIASASKNTPRIVSSLKIGERFDAIVDGRRISAAKPDPGIFLEASKDLGIPPEECVVIEDSVAGIEGAVRAGMKCVGVGSPEILRRATLVIRSTGELTLDRITALAGLG